MTEEYSIQYDLDCDRYELAKIEANIGDLINDLYHLQRRKDELLERIDDMECTINQASA